MESAPIARDGSIPVALTVYARLNDIVPPMPHMDMQALRTGRTGGVRGFGRRLDRRPPGVRRNS